MTDDVYKPPQADLSIEAEKRADQFYVVSSLKLSVLYFVTLGLYIIYWFYINWRNYREAIGGKLMPAPRSIFYIFFTHSLFNKVDKTLKEKGIEHSWSPNLWATLIVILALLSNVVDKIGIQLLGPSIVADLAWFLILPISLFALLKVQRAINISQGDSDGSSNSKFTGYNYVWIVLGVIFWLMMLIGLAVMLGVFPEV